MAVTRKMVKALCILYFLHPTLGIACAILPTQQDAERSRQIISEFKTASQTLKNEADLVFVGRLTKLVADSETAGSGVQSEQSMQKYRASFEVFEEIKGLLSPMKELEFTLSNRVWISVGCRAQFWQLPKKNGVGDSYLVFARDGKILRTNYIPTDAQTLNGSQEAAILRDAPK